MDGFPARMMAGARNAHDDIVVNVLAELRNQLRGRDCRPFTGDGAIEMKPGQIRRPDTAWTADAGIPTRPRRLVVIEPNAPEVIVWARGEGRIWPSKCPTSA